MAARLPMKTVREQLSKWETRLAPLSDEQKQVIVDISSATAQRPLPNNLPAGEVESIETTSTIDTPIYLQRIQEIKNMQELLSWFNEMDSDLESQQDGAYWDYCSQLRQYHTQCEELLSQLTLAIDSLGEMKDKHKFVSEKTQSLHEACEELMQEQNQVTQMVEGISNRLAYFTELEQLGQKLNAPSFSLTPDTFPVLLARLDECIAFLQSHLHYKESPVYLARFQHQLSRALGYVRQQIFQTLKTTTHSVLPPAQADPKALSENTYTQFYGKFRSCAPKIKALVREIENRSEKLQEYNTLLHDCLQCYSSQRSLLLTPAINATLMELHKTHKTDYCRLIRAGCTFLSRVCLDEYQLYLNFFSTESDEFKAFVQGLCGLMYNSLRPVIVHINHLETLTDICTIMKVEILEEIVEPKEKELVVFGMVIRQLQGDVQQRLVFRAQRFIQTDIHGYKPSPGDLAYPEKLVVAAEAQASFTEAVFSDNDSVFEASGTESEPATPDSTINPILSRRARRLGLTDLHAMWYPTVRRTLLCFSKLYRCIDRPVFESLAQEALSECVVSLLAASDGIKSKKGVTDSALFLIKHLLILREQITAFNVSFSVKEVYLDFTKTKAAAYHLLEKKSRLFSLGSNNAFLEFLFEGFPELIETQLDSRKEVDAHLKRACELFISHMSEQLCQPLRALMVKFDLVLSLAVKEGHDTSKLIQKQPFANAKDVHKVVSETNKLLKTNIPLLRRSLALYLSNEETEYILFRPIKANVMATYQKIEEIAANHYSAEDQQIISVLSQQEVALMMTVPSAPLHLNKPPSQQPATT